MKPGEMRIDKYVPGIIIKSKATGRTYLVLKEPELVAVKEELDYRSWLGRLFVYCLEDRRNTWLMAESYSAESIEHILGVKLDAEYEVLSGTS